MNTTSNQPCPYIMSLCRYGKAIHFKYIIETDNNKIVRVILKKNTPTVNRQRRIQQHIELNVSDAVEFVN